MRVFMTMRAAFAAVAVFAAVPAWAQAPFEEEAPALKPAAAPSRAEPGEPAVSTATGWNTPFAMLFTVNNVFTKDAVFRDFGGGVGGALFLSTEAAVRLTFDFRRQSNPPTVTRVTLENGADKATDYDISVPGTTSQSAANLQLDMMRRLSKTAVGPYLGLGVYANWVDTRRAYTDDVTTVDQVTTMRNQTTDFGFGLRATGGVEWRLHPSFSIFAEYQAWLEVVRISSFRDRTTVERTSEGSTSATRTTREGSTTAWLNTGVGLAHAGQLGLAAHF